MQWLNYNHLYYFWSVVRAGSINKAAAGLRLSPPAISTQVRLLEEGLGQKLFARVRGRLVLTDVGRTVYSYAEDIFDLGRELVDVVNNRAPGRPLRLDVGVVDVLPKMIAQWLIQPALRLREGVRVVCREAAADQLIRQLATHELDVVLSDSALDPGLRIRAYSHLLGETGIAFVGTTEVTGKLAGDFPACLHGQPMLLPTDNTSLRRNLDYWFETNGIVPAIMGEFEDYAMIRAFGQKGAGLFPVPSVFESEVQQQDNVESIGRTEEVRIQFFAISAERKIQHPAVMAICETARKDLFP